MYRMLTCHYESLARPGGKQATATKLGIYSTYSPRSSIHFLARCSNLCKPLKKIQKVVRPTRSIWSIISGVVTVLGRPGRGASQVEKSPRLNWATQFLSVAYDGRCSPNVSARMAWISFGALPCEGGGITWWQLASRCCWNHARRPTCFLSAYVTRKDLQFGTWTDPSFRRRYWFHSMTSGSSSG